MVSVHLHFVSMTILTTLATAESENRKVGSVQPGRDEVYTSPAPNEAAPKSRNDDLLDLDDIFGSSDVASPVQTAPSPTGPPAAAPRSAISDIMDLFDTSSSSSPAPGSTSSPYAGSPIPQASPYASTPPQVQSPPIQQQPQPQQAQPQQPRLTSYNAYDKNELKVSLTPQTSAARPGMVNIMARFQVSGSTPAVGVNFQAAVPKV